MTQDAAILDPAFEKRIEDVVAEKKNEIEKVLVDTIDQEKVKAKQRIAELEQEFKKEKDNLNRHKAMLEAVKSATEDIRDPLRKHIEQARHLKRGIIDQQELLRKVVLRAVKLCEKEKGLLPNHTSDIINVQK